MFFYLCIIRSGNWTIGIKAESMNGSSFHAEDHEAAPCRGLPRLAAPRRLRPRQSVATDRRGFNQLLRGSASSGNNLGTHLALGFVSSRGESQQSKSINGGCFLRPFNGGVRLHWPADELCDNGRFTNAGREVDLHWSFSQRPHRNQIRGGRRREGTPLPRKRGCDGPPPQQLGSVFSQGMTDGGREPRGKLRGFSIRTFQVYNTE